ncbi:HET-E protein, partial [Athelia psychrophila]
LEGQKANVNSALFSPDGNYILLVSNEHTVQLWDSTLHTQVLTLYGHKDEVICAAFSRNGAYIITGSHDRTIRIWNALTGLLLRTMENHSEVACVAISSDGNLVISGHFDTFVKFWMPWKKHPVPDKDGFERLGRHKRKVTGICLAQNDKIGASRADDNLILLWDVERKKLLREIQCKTMPTSLAFVNDSQLVSGLSDNNLYLWDVHSGARIKKFKGHLAPINCVSVAPSGTQMVSASADHSIKIWHVDNDIPSKTLTGHSAEVLSASFSYDGQQIVSASADQSVKVWDVVSINEMAPKISTTASRILLLAASPSGDSVIAVLDNFTMQLWSALNGCVLVTLKGHRAAVNAVCFSPNNNYIASASDDKLLRVWDAKTGVCSQVLKGHQDSVESVCYLNNNQFIASGSADGVILVQNAISGDRLHTYKGHQSLVTCISISSDDRLLASAASYTTHLWELDTEKELFKFTNPNYAYAVVFSPTNEIIATASIDMIIHLLDTTSG